MKLQLFVEHISPSVWISSRTVLYMTFRHSWSLPINIANLVRDC